MRTGILAVVALTTGGVVLADEPSSQPVPQQVIEDLSELRQEMGATNSSPAEFAQAVQNIAEQRVEKNRPRNDWAAQTWVGDVAPQPTQNPWNPGPAPEPAPPPGQVVPVSDVPLPPPPQYHQPGQFIATNPFAPGPPPGQVVPVVDERSTPQYYQPGPPPHFAPHPAPKPPRPPKVLLQDTAFDLERMAHELDKAELYGEADALRGAASRLRMAARQQKKADGRPQPPVADRPGPAPIEHPHAAERARRAVQEADQRVQQMERQVCEMEARIERQAEEARRQMQQMGERARQALEGAERARREAPEGRQRPKEGRRKRGDHRDQDHPDLPPPGVHGGPTDPPPPPASTPTPRLEPDLN